MKLLLVAALLTSATTVATTTVASTDSPYAGEQQRLIKALSAQEVEAYLNGRGLGYAKAAELNHYPGPRHVLDLAAELALTEPQRAKTERLYRAMQEQAAALGAELVAKEAELDRRFAADTIDAPSLHQLLEQIGALQGKIRYAHLQAHLEQKALLTEQQVRDYDQLRGYSPHNQQQAQPPGGHHHH